jgi:biopolymer transport protein ExbD
MARRRHRRTGNAPALSLFPFIDVLGGTIGILVLLIAIFAIQMQSGSRVIQLFADTGSVQQKSPRYVICDSKGVRIFNGSSEETIPSDSLRDGRLDSFLSKLQNQRNYLYLIIGVRPSGFEVFKTVRSMAEGLKIDVGYEPLDEGWQIKLPRKPELKS